MRLLTLFVVTALGLPATASSAEILSPEILLPAYETTDAVKPVVAFGKDVYLLVWQAGRNEQADIVGLRLDKTGKLLDPKPLVISKAKDCQQRPRIAYGGGVFLVVWHDLRNGKDWDVFAARVTPEGKTLDPDGIAVGQGARNQCEPGVGWDGKNFQVLWRGFQGNVNEIVAGPNPRPDFGYFIYGGRVSANGKPIDGAGVFMAKPPRRTVWGSNSMGMAALVPLSNGRLLAGGRSTNDLCLWSVDDGKPAGEPWLPTKRKIGFDDVAFATNGKTILATWSTFRDGGGRSSGVDKSGMMMLASEGKVEAAEPQSLSAAANEPRVRHPAPVWDGTRYVVVWDVPRKGKDFSYEALYLRTFAGDGAPAGNDEPVVDNPASPAYWPAAASDGAGTTLIAYEKHPETADTPIMIGFRMLSPE